MSEPSFIDHPLFRALKEMEMLEGTDLLGIEMANVAGADADVQPFVVLESLRRLKPIIDGGYISVETVMAGLAYAVEISVLSQDELREEAEKLRLEREEDH